MIICHLPERVPAFGNENLLVRQIRYRKQHLTGSDAIHREPFKVVDLSIQPSESDFFLYRGSPPPPPPRPNKIQKR